MPVLEETAIIGIDERAPRGRPDGVDAQQYWYALWTNSHSEQLVHDQLQAKGFDPFLPKINVWSRRRGERRIISVPMFAGYMFLRHPRLDTDSYIELSNTRGLVRVLGERWDRIQVVPDQDIEAIQKVLNARVRVTPYPYLREGQRVRILNGALADVEGILVRTKPNKGLVVLSVELLQRSAAVEVDCTLVAPV